MTNYAPQCLCYNICMGTTVGRRRPQAIYDQQHIASLRQHALSIRRNIIAMLTEAGSGHSAGSLDLVEIMTVLFFDQMRQWPDDPASPERDILVLSNGHTCPVLYATLAEAGYFDKSELQTLRQFGSRLQGHPERTAGLPGIETTSGPLGEGLSQAAGMAYYLKYLAKQPDRKVYCVMGDGELNEGNVWEAAMFAAKYKLDNLIAIIDKNHIQLSGKTKDIMPMPSLHKKWADFGWRSLRAFDGNDVVALCNILGGARNVVDDRPRVVIAYTTPGEGIKFMENDYHWHGKVPTPGEAERALYELAGGDDSSALPTDKIATVDAAKQSDLPDEATVVVADVVSGKDVQ